MKISELGLAGALSGTEVLPIVQSGTTKKVSIDDVVALAGGGGTNPTSTYIPVNNSGTFSDSFIISDDANSILKTYYQNENKGIYLDFANNQYKLGSNNQALYISDSQISTQIGANNLGINIDTPSLLISLGDYNNYINGIKFEIDIINSIIKTSYQSQAKGIFLDFTNSIFSLGDFIGINNSSSLTINDNLQQATINCAHIELVSGGTAGFLSDSSIGISKIGDINNNDSGTIFIVDNNNTKIYSKIGGNDKGLMLDFINSTYKFGAIDSGICGLIVNDNASQVYFGDTTNNGNGTTFGITDSNESLIGSANLVVATSGSVSGKHLKINLGGTDYVIELKNP